MSQIKIADKKRRRSPLLPVLGLLIGITLAVFSYAIEEPFIKLVMTRFPQAGLTQSPEPFSTTRLLLTFGIWLFLVAFFSMLTLLLSGRTPNDAKDIIMPPRTEAERDRRYGGDL